jgi:glucose/galactose transporter
MYRTFSIFLIGLFIMGTGLALLQTAVNPYITILGPRETAAVRFSIMGICNNIAGAIGPLVLAYYILNDGDAFVAGIKLLNEADRIIALNGLASRVIWPYLIMTVVLIILGALVKFSPLPDIDEEVDDVEIDQSDIRTHVIQYPHLILGVIALFFYVGAEVIAGNTIMGYGLSLGVSIDSAKSYTTMVMVTMLLGYVLGIILIPKILSYRKVLISSAILGILFTVFALTVPTELSFTLPVFGIEMPLTIVGIAFLGLANSMIWPSIWPLAIHNLGRFIKQGSALMIMAIAGGAVLPVVWGHLSDLWSARYAYIILIPTYIIIFLYGLLGYKLTSWKRKK